MAHFQKAMSPGITILTKFATLSFSCLDLALLCTPVSRSRCHTKYFYALATQVKFQSFPVAFITFLIRARLSHPASPSKGSLEASTFSAVIKICMLCVLVATPNASMIVFQSVLFLCAPIEDFPSSPGPNSLTW